MAGQPFSPTDVSIMAVWRGPRRSSNLRSRLLGLGAHRDPTTAHRIATAEAAERVAAGRVPWQTLDYGPLNTSGNQVDPRTLVELSERQAAHARIAIFDPARSYYWTDGEDVLRGRCVHILADLCYYPFRPRRYPQRVAWATSSGMAAGPTRAAAERSAILELFERDALMAAWMNRAHPPRIGWTQCSPDLQRKQRRVERLGYTVMSLDLTCRAVPVALIVAHRDTRPALVIGIAAGFSLREALRAAWRELEMELFWRFYADMVENTPHSCPEPADVLSPADHAAFYDCPLHRSSATFLWKTTRETSRDLDERLSVRSPFALGAFCRIVGLDTLYRVTYAAPRGLTVIRLVSPQLVPLLFGYNQFPLTHQARRAAHWLEAGPPWPGPIPPHPLD